MTQDAPKPYTCAERAMLIEALEAAEKRLVFADKHIDCSYELEQIRAALTAAKATP